MKREKINSQPYESVAMNENRVAFSGGVAFVEENGKYIMVDSKAERVGSQSFDEAKPFENGEMAAVRIGEKWGFADKDGNVIIEAKYDEARSFSNGLAAVREGETWGYINAENETAIEFALRTAKTSITTDALCQRRGRVGIDKVVGEKSLTEGLCYV